MNNRNISVSKSHGYELEKVKYAMEFVKNAGRYTTVEDWVRAYNYIKGKNETAQGCKACKAAKYTAAVRNYAQYGYLTLLNYGHKPEEFINHPEPLEVKEDVVEETPVEETVEKAEEAVNEESEEEEAETVGEEKPKRKYNRKKK